MTPPAPDVPAARPSRLPAVTAAFWVVKVLTTGMGETTSDFLVKRFPPEVVVPLALLALVGALAVQLRVRRHVAAVCWTAALMVSVFGTMAADVLHVGLGVPYVASTLGFTALLAIVLLTRYRTERTLSVHAVTTGRREAFYWASSPSGPRTWCRGPSGPPSPISSPLGPSAGEPGTAPAP